MRSLKRIINSLVITVLIIVISFTFLNFLLIKNINDDLALINQSIYSMNRAYEEVELPIRVLSNINSQITSKGSLEESSLKNLSIAYDNNRLKLIVKTNKLMAISFQLKDNVTDLSKWSILNLFTDLNDFVQLNQQLNEEISHVEESIGVELFVNKTLKPQNISIIQDHYQHIDNYLTSFSKRYNEITQDLFYSYIFFITILAFVVLFCMLVLHKLLSRLLNKDIDYLLKSFTKLSNHDHNEMDLPKIDDQYEEEKKIKDYVTKAMQEQRFLDSIKQATSKGYIIDEILENLFHTIHDNLRTDRVGIAFVDYNRKKIIAEHGILRDSDIVLGPGFEVDFKSTTLTTLLETKVPKITCDIHAELELRPNSPSLNKLVKENIRSNMIFPMILDNSVFAFLFFSSRVVNNYEEKDLKIGQNIANELSVLLDKSFLTKTVFSKMTNAFAYLVDQKDNETGDHISRMVSYSVILAKGLFDHPNPHYKVDSCFIKDIENNASVHDIGKVAIPDDILKKPGKLTEDEWIIMRTHTSIGGDIFGDLKDSLRIFNRDFYKVAEDITRYHHEKWDGSGYPLGLVGQDIPLAARIVALGDVFDALTSKRVYKEAFSFEKPQKLLMILLELILILNS